MRRRRLPLAATTALALAGIWLIVEDVLPLLTMWLAGAERPVPLPRFARVLYLSIALAGAAVYATTGDRGLRELARPVIALLRPPRREGRHAALLRAARLALLLLLPLAAGAVAYARAGFHPRSPVTLRTPHPAMPIAYEGLSNPLRGGDVEGALAEGRVLFQINCRPCHGDAADGAGPVARGLRLKPANFTDPGTIATVVEAYAFWRVTEGAPGLPPEAAPWDSAMPAWKADLSEDQRWKAILAAYDLAGVEPRKREGRLLSPSSAGSRPAGPHPGGASMSAPPPPESAFPTTGPRDPARSLARTEEPLERGRQIYLERCQVCHGEKGDGRGPVAPYLDPRPRDFTAGVYKLRETPSGEPPTDDDLFRVITRGIPGTAMSGWTTLAEADRRLVVAYIETFSDAFKTRGTPLTPKPVRASPDVIARGREVYQRAKCWECHGEAGRGDGPSAPTLTDDAGNPIAAADLQKGWRLKGGREAREIFLRLSTGMDGTPMPSYSDALGEEERWALAHYVTSLQTPEEPSSAAVLVARWVSGPLPRSPGDPRWRSLPSLAVPLAGQVIARPRWQTHSVDAVTVRALHSDAEIAFLLEWHDRTKDVLDRPRSAPRIGEFGYPLLDGHRPLDERLRDAVRLQFPLASIGGPERPHFFLGSRGRPVALWHWKADLNEAGAPSVIKEVAEGWERPIREPPASAQDVAGTGLWERGRWQVVLVRPLAPGHPGTDATFERGTLIPFALQAWDGSNGEQGLMMSLSSWNFLVLEPPRSPIARLSPLLVVVLAGLAEWWLVRKVLTV